MATAAAAAAAATGCGAEFGGISHGSLSLGDGTAAASADPEGSEGKRSGKRDSSGEHASPSKEGTSPGHSFRKEQSFRKRSIFRSRSRGGIGDLGEVGGAIAGRGILGRSLTSNFFRPGRVHPGADHVRQAVAARRRTKPWFIIDPRRSKASQVWDAITMISLLFTAAVTPFEVAILDPPPTWEVLRRLLVCVDGHMGGAQ